MKKEFDESYEQLIKESEILPEEWIPFYKVAACLKDSPNKKTYLLEDKKGKEKYILKIAEREEAGYLFEEGRIIQEGQRIKKDKEIQIQLKGLIRKGDTVYLIRNYVGGISLAETGELRSFSEEEIIRSGIMLCRNVRELHQRKPPVIHRDIKPENIIIKADGSLVLIDFETARTYKKGKREDTCFVGTRETAAPEQFGFGQSDERTDIYGIGKTLLYMVTGDYIPEELEKVSGNRKLNRIIRKCCAFEPDHRYVSVDRAIRELQGCLSDSQKDKRRLRVLTILVALLSMIVLMLGIQVAVLKIRVDHPEADSKQTTTKKETGGFGIAEKNSGRIIRSGWDVTEYDCMLEQIVTSCEQKDYERISEQCRQLIIKLYEDDFLQAVDAEDTYYYAPDDVRWESYPITRMGYELVADKLTYHDRMLEKEIEYFDEYQYYIAMSVRGMVEATEVDEKGDIQYTLLHRYNDENSAGKADVDFSIGCLLDAVISGIESCDTENK